MYFGMFICNGIYIMKINKIFVFLIFLFCLVLLLGCIEFEILFVFFFVVVELKEVNFLKFGFIECIWIEG